MEATRTMQIPIPTPVTRRTTACADAEFRRMWDRASRLASHGRQGSARRVWARALRHSIRRGCDRSMQVALRGLGRTDRIENLGPAATPAPVRSSVARAGASTVFRTVGGTYALDRRQVEGFLRAVPVDLVVDTVRRQVHAAGRSVGMEGRDIPLNILAVLIRHEGQAITMEQLFEAAWGRRYNAAFDANTVYFHVCRLRKILEEATGLTRIVIKVADGYQLKSGLRFGLIESPRAARPARAVEGRDAALALLEERGFIDNRTYCEVTRSSRSTALRELGEMVVQGLLVRAGQGRSARYQLAARAA